VPNPEEEDDPDLGVALAASLVEEAAKWSHLEEVLRTSVLEEEDRRAREDTDTWAFLDMARR
jgi:hypothetical protein